jgi:hypothetical protein
LAPFDEAAQFYRSVVRFESMDHSNLVTVREVRTANAFSPDLSRQLHYVKTFKTMAAEEIRAVGETEDTPKADYLGFYEAGLHDTTAEALALPALVNREGLELGKIGPNHVQASAAHYLFFTSRHIEVTQVLVQLGESSMKHVATLGEEVDEPVHFGNVAYGCFFDCDFSFHLSGPTTRLAPLR